MPQSPYKLSIDLNVLEHLGLNLYSNIPAVLSEIVANAWDADARRVDVKLDRKNKSITIEDDGEGMDLRDANTRYLTVGYRRRLDQRAITPKLGRPVMGRKGIGKLAPFSIADEIEVRSRTRRPAGCCSFGMTASQIARMAKRGGEYRPRELPMGSFRKTRGTRIVLRKLKRGMSDLTAQALRIRIARRFSIIGSQHKFQVYVDGIAVTAQDRGFQQTLQFLWEVGQGGVPLTLGKFRGKKTEVLSGLVDEELGYELRGWIGTVDERKNLDDNVNAIVLMARGKLVHEDILASLGEGGVFTKYIVGELEAEFLDRDDDPDIATSDRQHVKENDPRFEKLVRFVKETLIRRIENTWRNWRNEVSEERARTIPVVDEWFMSLKPDRRRHARSLFQKIESLRLPDDGARREVYKHGILAFETLVLKDKLSVLDAIDSEKDFALLREVFADIDELEAFEYYNIVKARVEVLHKFENIVPTARERIIQEHIFEHLWLLHPSWERASTNLRIEQSVTKEFRKITLTTEEKRGRIDIRYRTAAGKHIIIELKKYKVKVDVADLLKQVRKYRRALLKCLERQYPNEPRLIEIICVLGSPPTPEEDDRENREQLKSLDARYITYDTLILET